MNSALEFIFNRFLQMFLTIKSMVELFVFHIFGPINGFDDEKYDWSEALVRDAVKTHMQKKVRLL